MKKIPRHTVRCPPCFGKGRMTRSDIDPCPLCNGKGFIPDVRIKQPVCAFCSGEGKPSRFSIDLCSVCDGWGRLPPEAGQVVEHSKPENKATTAREPRTRSAALASSGLRNRSDTGKDGIHTYDRCINWLKNKKPVVAVLLLVAVIITVGKVADSCESIRRVLPWETTSTPMPITRHSASP